MKLSSTISLVSISIALFILAGSGYYYLIWISLAPLFYLATTLNWKEYSFYVLLFSLTTGVFYLYWIKNYTTKYWWITFSTWIIYFLLVFLATKLTYQKTDKDHLVYILTAPSIFVLLQYFPVQSTYAFWLQLGIFQPQLAPVIWYIGTTGITFLIILFNSLLASLFKKKTILKTTWLFLLGAILITASIYSQQTNFYSSNKKIKIATIQADISRGWDWRRNNVDKIFQRYQDLTYQIETNSPDIIIWPEYAIPADFSRHPQLKNEAKQISKEMNSVLVLGSLSWVKNFNHTNRALVFDKGEYIGAHDGTVFFPDPTTKVVAGNKKQKPFKTSAGNFTINMCFEEIARTEKQLKDKPIHFELFLANNQDLTPNKGKRFAALWGVTKSAENKIFAIRSANQGYSYTVSPTGKIIKKTDEKILKSTIPLKNTQKSFYARHKNLLINSIVFISFLVFIFKILPLPTS